MLHGIAKGLTGGLVGHHLKARRGEFDGASPYDANMPFDRSFENLLLVNIASIPGVWRFDVSVCTTVKDECLLCTRCRVN